MYRLGQVGTGTIAHDLNRWWAKLRGKTDPYQRIGAENNREESGGDYVWALQDINLEVQQGQILGIIGRNGAGKSTLLKLLSRVTAPTTGSIKARGRMASLLEVGTGFHPELTGRENIFLNGAILGMSRVEIKARFDEIVDFSGCAKYIDTPVKRYSSGMYVRLAFAVAAHLEPEILIVDEVLAVGDFAFQSRCLSKLKEVTHSGERTVLFVSHSMAAIKNICSHCAVVSNGRMSFQGSAREGVAAYLSDDAVSCTSDIQFDETNSEFELVSASVRSDDGGLRVTQTADIYLQINYRLLQPIQNLRVGVTVFGDDGTEILNTSDFNEWDHQIPREPGHYTSTCILPKELLNVGSYSARITVDIPNDRVLAAPRQRLTIAIEDLEFDQTGVTYDRAGNVRSPFGVIHPRLDWHVNTLERS